MQEVKVSIPLIGSNLFKCVGMKSAILALCHIVSIPLIGSNLFKSDLLSQGASVEICFNPLDRVKFV